MKRWVEREEVWQKPKDAIVVEDFDGNEWIALYLYKSIREDYPNKHLKRDVFDAGWRREAFIFGHSFLIHKRDYPKISKVLKALDSEDRMHHLMDDLDPYHLIGDSFWGEYEWRKNWPSLSWKSQFNFNKEIEEIPILKPVGHYEWESHRDASEQQNVSIYFPIPELVSNLNLSYPVTNNPYIALNQNGDPIITYISERSNDEPTAQLLLIKRDAFENYLAKFNLCMISYVFGEKNAYINFNVIDAERLRFDMFVSFDGKEIIAF